VAEITLVKGETSALDRTWMSMPDGSTRQVAVHVVHDLPHLVVVVQVQQHPVDLGADLVQAGYDEHGPQHHQGGGLGGTAQDRAQGQADRGAGQGRGEPGDGAGGQHEHQDHRGGQGGQVLAEPGRQPPGPGQQRGGDRAAPQSAPATSAPSRNSAVPPYRPEELLRTLRVVVRYCTGSRLGSISGPLVLKLPGAPLPALWRRVEGGRRQACIQ
jgi:hypothetical protein